MIIKNNFFKNYFNNSKQYNQNLAKTKKFFKNFLLDLKNDEIPLLKSYEKSYEYDFTKKTIKKFSKYNNIIVIGIGGSILGTKSIYSFFKSRVKKKIFFFDNLDLNLLSNYKKIKNLKNSCFVVVSKSGNTLETLTNLGVIFSKKIMKNRLVIITEIKDSSLMNFADKHNAEVIEHKKFIGGRYSVLSESSMFPSALMGLNLKKFKNLQTLIRNKKFTSSLIHNVAAIYTLYSKKINNSIILNYNSNLNDLGFWYQQLVAESLGKKGKGINPVLSTAPKDHHSLLQLYLDGPKDKFFTFFSTFNKSNKIIDVTLNAQCRATKNIFSKRKIPFREFIFKKNDEGELGLIFTFFVLETILLSYLMNINPYDQPAVEQIKIETKKYLR